MAMLSADMNRDQRQKLHFTSSTAAIEQGWSTIKADAITRLENYLSS